MSPTRTFFLAVVLTTFGLAGPPGPASAEGEAPPAPAGSGNTVAVLEIQGMVTSSCPVLLRKALENVDGVARVQADHQTKRAEVAFDARQGSIERIRAIIKDRLGFDSKVQRIGAPRAQPAEKDESAPAKAGARIVSCGCGRA